VLRIIYAACFVFTIAGCAWSQDLSGAITPETCIGAPLRRIDTSKLISYGVINGRAIKLVVPDYPRIARALSVAGLVEVLVVINERGCVIKADAYAGHPLLRYESVKAALHSMFEPVTLSGRPIRVTGIITYNYLR
jgi:hypothetical protein